MNRGGEILADIPLENPADDRLGYAPFAQNLAEALCNLTTNECLVFALYGSWGSGKTTCINFVLHYLNKKPKEKRPIIMRFNPWWFSGHGELLNQFFKGFLIVLGKEEKLKVAARLLADFFEIISEIPEPTGIIKFGKALSRGLRISSREKEAWEVREKIGKCLKEQSQRILVVIDDIDRLTIDEIRDLFMVIKAVADFPNTLYLLAFDKSVVTKALESLQGISGYDFLEKIVQVPFELPLPDKVALRNLFLAKLDILLSDTPHELFDQTYWGNVFWDGIDHFLNTMRNIKRLINAIKVTYDTVKAEVNPVDFIAVKTIELFSSNIYQLIRANPSMFTGHADTHGYSSAKIEDIKPFHNKWVEQLHERDREVVKKLLLRLFPKLEAVFGNTNYGSEWESSWRKQLRICSPDIYPVYFRLSIPAGEISYSELEANLALAENVKAFSNKLLELSRQHRPDGSTRVSAFLERMEDYTEEEISIEHIPNILQALFNVGDQLLLPEDEGRGFFSWGNDMRIGRLTFQLIKRYKTKEERFNILKEVFSGGQAVSMIVREVATLGQQHGKLSGQKKPVEECLISAQQQEKLEKIGLQKIQAASVSDDFIKTPRLGHVLYRWRDWEGEKPVREWTAQAISTDEGLVDLLTDFLSMAHSHSLSDRVVKIKHRIDPKNLEPFLNPDEIIGRCTKLLESPPDWLKDRKKLAVETFIKSYKLRAEGKDPAWDFDE